ncbi:MAG: hypothetical protein IPL78_30745 [Chloroflexi bacterium]|nr:hypothetical protein [Chloroflexota bacterium]
MTSHLPALAGLVDLSAERERLTKELADLQGQMEIESKLLNSPLLTRPADVVQKKRKTGPTGSQSRQERERLQALSSKSDDTDRG